MLTPGTTWHAEAQFLFILANPKGPAIWDHLLGFLRAAQPLGGSEL